MPSTKVVEKSNNAIKLDKTPYASLINMIPPITNKLVVVEITDANYPIVNAIRRTIIAEMPVKYLTASLTEISSDDPYIIKDFMHKQLEMIPVSQSIAADSIFSIKVENNTDFPLDVLSNDIKLNGVTTSKDIVPMIPLCNINSGKSFSINNIHVATSYGFDNSRITFGKVGYEILDQDFSVSSLQSSPTKFRIPMEFSGFVDPLDVFGKAIKCLIERLDAIDYSKSIVEFDVYKLSIINETHSIGGLLSWYIYHLEQSIDYCSYRILHPSKRECVLDVRHPSAEELCKKAVIKIKKDLMDIGAGFM